MSSVTLEMELKERINYLEDELCTATEKLRILEDAVDNYEHLYEAEGIEQ